MNPTIKNTVTLCTLLLALCTPALADTDWTKMKRDLTIQESVLDRFFDTEEGSTTGLYIENYGVVLIARDSEPDIHFNLTKTYGIGSRVQVRMIGDKNEHDKSSPNVHLSQNENQIERQKKQITEFLSTYGNAIGQLKDDDRVTVLLQSPGQNISLRIAAPKVDYRIVDTDSTNADTVHVEKHVYRTPGSRHQIDIEQIVSDVHGQIQSALHEHGDNIQVRVKTINDNDELHRENKDTRFEATVTKRDIDAFSRGKIDEQTFQNRITFKEHKPEPTRDKKIDIMADILSSALKSDSDLHILGHTKSTGLYQKGVGALFLISHQPDLSGTDLENEPNPLDTTKTTIIETLADYGATLRNLSQDESIIVHTTLNGTQIVRINRNNKTTNISGPSKRPERLLFRVSKNDIDAYASGKLNLEAFRKKVEITEM